MHKYHQHLEPELFMLTILPPFFSSLQGPEVVRDHVYRSRCVRFPRRRVRQRLRVRAVREEGPDARLRSEVRTTWKKYVQAGKIVLLVMDCKTAEK